MPSVLGIDLGGTKMTIVRYAGRALKEEETKTLSTSGKPFSVIVEEMLDLIQQFRTADTKAIGIGVPGLVNSEDGCILTMPNIADGDGYPLRETLRKKTGLTVSVENDSACFTLAEAEKGAGKGYRIVIGITMGTGVGGGIVMDRKIFRGNHGYSAEFGHMLLRPGDPPLGQSEGRGEIEEYLSGTALLRRCPAAKNPVDLLSGPTCASLHSAVIQEVAWMVANLTHCIDPGIIVFGGSAGHALKPHLPAIRKELKKWMLPGSRLPSLAIGSLSNAGTLGAALLTQTNAT